MNSPYIIKNQLANLSSNANLVMTVDNEFKEAVRANAKDLELMYTCWDSYFAIDGSQWEREKLMVLRSQGRDARSFDIISPKVDTLAGSLISELPDMDWIPVEGQKSTATDAIKDAWYNDKELTNSEYELMLTIRDGLVHIGWCQLVEVSMEGKPSIGIKRIMPGFFVPSAYWIQESDRDLDCGFKIAYLTPEQLKFKYKAKSGEIEQAIDVIKQAGHEELPSNAYEQRRQYISKIADHYQVIEKHYLERIDTTRLVGAKIETNPYSGEPTGQIRWMPFPLTKDRQQLENFAFSNQIDWESVEEIPYTDTIHNVQTIVPDLAKYIVLEDGKSKIQTKGMPFYKFTVSRFNGRNKGIVPSLLDVQRTINERESLVTELISKANGGSEIVDENIFPDPKRKQDFIRNSNKPGRKFLADLSQSRSGVPIFQVGANQYPSQLIDQIGRMYDVCLPLMSRVSDSLSAKTDSGKSGVLFEREVAINKIGNMLMDKGIKQMMDHIAEGYFFQWQIANMGIEREVTSRDGKRKTKLNERFINEYGQEMIRNAVGFIPRCRALVTNSTKSPTYQMRNRMIYNDLMQTVNPEVSPEYFDFVFNKFMKTLDLPEQDKAELESLSRMMIMKAKMKYVQDVTGIHAGTKVASLEAANADMQLAQIMAQMQQLGIAGQPQPAVPEQITEATNDVVQPASPEPEPPQATGSDIAEVQ